MTTSSGHATPTKYCVRHGSRSMMGTRLWPSRTGVSAGKRADLNVVESRGWWATRSGTVALEWREWGLVIRRLAHDPKVASPHGYRRFREGCQRRGTRAGVSGV